MTGTGTIAAELREKLGLLHRRLQSLDRLLVAYSGGVDSAFLAEAAHQALGESMRAVLADSPSLARSQMRDAVAFAQERGMALDVIRTGEMARPEYVKNDAARCFHCKDELFGVMEQHRERLGFAHIAFGMNADDGGDFRPGQQAARLHGVVAPLAEAGLTKSEVRELARREGLRLWDKPASACLSSRIEYGRQVTPEALAAVEEGEERLRALGFRQFRVRHHGELVRIEIAKEEMPRAFSPEMAAGFTAIFKALGFKFVTLDCEGYRSGSMNALLAVEDIKRANDPQDRSRP